jgi:hypothetical protein
MRPTLILMTICAVIISCKKEPLDINLFWQCNNSQNLDSASISNKLTGSWTWTKQSCFWSGKTTNADKNVKVIFNSNATFSVSENTNIVTHGSWKLTIVDSNMWGLDLTSPSDYLYGRIIFCENQVLFNNSYIDGCDNLFFKY